MIPKAAWDPPRGRPTTSHRDVLEDHRCVLFTQKPKLQAGQMHQPVYPLGNQNAYHMICVTRFLFKSVPWGFTALFLEGGGR